MLRIAGVLALWSFLGSPAFAEQRLTVGHAGVSYGGYFRSVPSAAMLELGWARPLPDSMNLPLEFGAGLRATTPGAPGIPLEGWARLRFVASIGPWRPSVGVELGLTGRAQLGERADRLPNDVDVYEQERFSALYTSFESAPLRFAIDRFTLSVFELGLGTTLAPPGATFRLSLSYLRAEVSL